MLCGRMSYQLIRLRAWICSYSIFSFNVANVEWLVVLSGMLS